MKKEDLLQQLTQGLDLPGEPLPGMPIVEISGDRQVLIENHMGVTAYCCSQIGVKVKYGEVLVMGNCLKLVRMTKSQLIIGGHIDTICLQRRKQC